jgi:hypothetical protein
VDLNAPTTEEHGKYIELTNLLADSLLEKYTGKDLTASTHTFL